MAPDDPPTRSHRQLGRLIGLEIWWRDHSDWLQQRGYRMRSRYRPGWTPPWTSNINALMDINSWPLPNMQIMDTVRISDGKFIALKIFRKRDAPDEEAIHRLFGMGELALDPRNHCIPLYDVLDVPDDPATQILSMPYGGLVDYPPWDTVGEALDCVWQIVEGLTFMHEHNFAHRDIKDQNILMDIEPIFPDAFHPADRERRRDGKGSSKWYPRTRRYPRYWLIDFGLSRLYRPEDGPPVDIIGAGFPSRIPEYRRDEQGLHDQFAVDVFCLGYWIREQFIAKHKHNVFHFLHAVTSEMCAEDPTKRPKMPEVLERLEKFIARADVWTLRARPKSRDEPFWVTPFRVFGHWWRQIFYVVTRTPAVPRRRTTPTAASASSVTRPPAAA